MKRIIHLTLILALMSGATGCSSTQQRGGITALGAAAGGSGAYMLARGKSSGEAAAYTAAGAAGGALLTSLALGKDKEAIAEGYQAGYQQAQSDSIKREYWLRQEAERREDGSGRTSYYTLPVQDDTGGVSRVPHTVTVPVVE